MHDALDLDRLLGTEENDWQEIEPTFSYFGLQLKNVSFALTSFAKTLECRADSLKGASPFELERSIHTG